ncbi:hypothetical protein [Dyadobacter psychrotolerans]|uniref:Uncharacterized protein n=1 Tax=Dyadobacter psychrotolerans TaxID=2541721 RepID=A0A4R5D9R8_9BACT|nr:hypothetical protein [Dyadobacter psychrotolerans]TDE10319.1 hypothetical protein E0F88_28930 [Dyadobacter psychrotolerans]
MTVYFLRVLSIIFLILPNLIFFLYWTNSYIAALGTAILSFIFLRVLNDKSFDKKEGLNHQDLLILSGVALLLTVISGTSGICYQTKDYWCHNTKFNELFSYDWPFKLPMDGPIVSYYYGYYVVPALLFKWLGEINESIIFIWTSLGFFLGACWIYLAVNKKILFALLALSVGDTPLLIKMIFFKSFDKMYELQDFGIESWSGLENSFWVPNQVIPTLIIGGMFVYVLKSRLKLEYIVLPVALTFWWAVFPAFTSGLLVGILILKKWYTERSFLNWREITIDVILPFAACLPVLLLFLSHEQAPISGFLWQFENNMVSRFFEYTVNIGINVVIFALIYFYLKNTGQLFLPALPFLLIVFFITLFPIYRLGKVNDFLFRGLMPLLIIAGLYLYYPLSLDATYSDSWRRLKKTPILLLLFIAMSSSSVIALQRIYRAATVNGLTKRWYPEKVRFEPIPYDAYPNVYEVLRDKWTQMEADQYLGKKDSFYEKNIAPGREQK